MAIIPNTLDAAIHEINGLLDKQNIKKESLSGELFEEEGINGSLIKKETIDNVKLEKESIEAEQIKKSTITDEKFSKPLIIGNIKSNGEVNLGTGFTSEKTSTGNYKITLSTELNTVGILVATVISGFEGFVAVCSEPAKKVFSIIVINGTPTAKDAGFNFYIKAL